MNSNLKKQYNQRGVVATDNINGYIRTGHVTFPIPYKEGTYPGISLAIENYQNTATDVRLTALYKHITNTEFDVYVCDHEGQIAGAAYNVMWMAVGEID